VIERNIGLQKQLFYILNQYKKLTLTLYVTEKYYIRNTVISIKIYIKFT
jgi:hypothetical protein